RELETRSESVLLFNNSMLPAVVNRIYYSMFYALSALAISEGFQTAKHAHAQISIPLRDLFHDDVPGRNLKITQSTQFFH
ncbi:MAG TPA: hypothetical protein PLZ53_10215, partial [Candidatus Hydrogenedentes bacterium]|nr:hypothetical protein [Candidatus Hydrogenedentota bacterium]